eukprot:241553_1
MVNGGCGVLNISDGSRVGLELTYSPKFERSHEKPILETCFAVPGRCVLKLSTGATSPFNIKLALSRGSTTCMSNAIAVETGDRALTITAQDFPDCVVNDLDTLAVHVTTNGANTVRVKDIRLCLGLCDSGCKSPAQHVCSRRSMPRCIISHRHSFSRHHYQTPGAIDALGYYYDCHCSRSISRSNGTLLEFI